LQHLSRELQITTVYVTHDQVEAMTLADRVAVMQAGKIRQLDTPEVIHDAPADLFVAGFIGSPPMNLIPGALADGRFVAPEINLSLPQTAGATKPGVVFGARPEDIEVVDDGDAHFRAQVYAFEKIGDSALATVEVAANRITVRTDRGLQLNIGDTVTLRVDLTRAQLFDAATGLRMRDFAILPA